MIHGLVIVSKIKGMTSHAVVEEIRRLFKIKKVGHFGTLDPFAQGLLLIGIGFTTKFFDFFIKKKKLYTGLIKFGQATTTYDCEGMLLEPVRKINLNTIDLDSILKSFSGKISQKPPMFSAKKYKGKPLYKYARENKPLDIRPIEVEIFSMRTKIIEEDLLWFETLTSSGTYIRSLAHDMGQKVGVGAFLQELIREKIGEFSIDQSVTLEELKQCRNHDELTKYVIPIESLLPEFPKIIVNKESRKSVLNGMSLHPKDVFKAFPAEDKSNFRLFDDEGKLLAIAKKDENQLGFKPYIVFPE